MTLSRYLTVQQIVMGGIMALGGHLLFGHIPDKLRGSRIHISGQVMGVTAMVLPVASFIYYFSDMQSGSEEYATAINLTAYCLMSTLIALAYYILLDRPNDKRFLRVHLAVGLLYPLPLWGGLCCGSEFIAKHTIVACYTLFCVLAIVHISSCLYLYRQKRLHFIEDEDATYLQEVELKLLGRTLYASLGLIIVSILAPSFFSYPMWLGGVFVCCFIVGVVYIYICYNKIVYHNINALIQIEEEEELEEEYEAAVTTKSVVINDEVLSHIERNLKNWVAKGRFRSADISINNVAKAVYTNRTYLSRYINSVHQCSFKTWVTQLRVEESKRLMVDSPELPISDIARRVGFASVESFSHTFTRYVQCSPSRWRESRGL